MSNYCAERLVWMRSKCPTFDALCMQPIDDKRVIVLPRRVSRALIRRSSSKVEVCSQHSVGGMSTNETLFQMVVKTSLCDRSRLPCCA